MSDTFPKERYGRWGKVWYIETIDHDGFDIHAPGGIVGYSTTWERAWEKCKERGADNLEHVPMCECCGSEMHWHSEWENRYYWLCGYCDHAEFEDCDNDYPPLTTNGKKLNR